MLTRRSAKFGGLVNALNGGSQYPRAAITITDPSGRMLANAYLPPALSLMGTGTQTLAHRDYRANGSQYGFTSTLTSLNVRGVSPVPEPASYAMLALGLMAVGAAARRQKK